jgi:two-component system cell cycle sensor histidine kinase PleC
MRNFSWWSTREAPRFTEARLHLIVDTLPPSIILNPLWTAILYLPFASAPEIFGHIPLSHLAWAAGLHGALAVVIASLWWRLRDEPNILPFGPVLFLLQFSLSCAWGAMLCLFCDGGVVNTLYVGMIFVSVVWAIVFTRTAQHAVFLAGLIPVSVIFTLRLFTTPGEVARVICEFLPFWTVYIWVMGVRGRAAIDKALMAQFANEDLSVALRASHAEAQRGRMEAETANAAKTNFLANMSHELRTPLNAILGFSDIIAHRSLGPDAGARYAEYAADIHASGAHLLSLINDLLDVAKIEAGKMEIDPRPLDAERLLEEIQRLIAPRAETRSQSLFFDIMPGLPALTADERALRQIVLNLLSNAVKFTAPGGHIAVRLNRSGEGFLLEVSDDGPGIDPEKVAHVFEPFSQIDNRYGRQAGGTGLGLALVKGLAELHGGNVWIESVLGHGTRVFVYVPLANESRGGLRVANG